MLLVLAPKSSTIYPLLLKWTKTTFFNVFVVYQMNRRKLVLCLMKKATMIEIGRLMTVVLLTYLTTQVWSTCNIT